MEPTLYEPVNLGYVPSFEIEQALAERNNDRVWRALELGLNPEAFYDTVRSHTFNKTMTHKRGHAQIAQTKSSLICVPVIVEPEVLHTTTARDYELSCDATMQIATEIQTWSKYQSTACLIPDVMDYHKVSANEPVEIRQLLDALVDQTLAPQEWTMAEGARFAAMVPEDAPRLKFLIGAFTRLHNWPGLPAPDAAGSAQFALRIESMLRFGMNGKDAMTGYLKVFFPELAEQAIETGIKGWLTALSEKYHFGRWDVIPRQGDRVDLIAEIPDTQTNYIQIPIRTYQVGVKGVERIIAHLGKLAAHTTAPADMVH